MKKLEAMCRGMIMWSMDGYSKEVERIDHENWFLLRSPQGRVLFRSRSSYEVSMAAEEFYGVRFRTSSTLP